MHVYVAFVTETLCDQMIAAVEPPPRRNDRRSEHGLPIACAIDVYMDTRMRGLGLWVEDTGFKYFAVKPRRLPAGVTGVHRASIERRGLMIGAPMWVSPSTGMALTTDRARIEGKRLLSLVPTLTPWEGHLDADGVLELDYRHPRPAYSTRRCAQPR